jgi:hypothetical protein
LVQDEVKGSEEKSSIDGNSITKGLKESRQVEKEAVNIGSKRKI